MRLPRLFTAVLAASTLAACATDSPTAPSAPPALDTIECTRIEVQKDGGVVWECAPHMGSGG